MKDKTLKILGILESMNNLAKEKGTVLNLESIVNTFMKVQKDNKYKVKLVYEPKWEDFVLNLVDACDELEEKDYFALEDLYERMASSYNKIKSVVYKGGLW